MQIDKSALSKLLNLSDEDFKNKVKSAATASGVENEKLDKALNDVQTLKNTLSNLSESELKQMATVIGTDKIEDIMKKLKDNTK